SAHIANEYIGLGWLLHNIFKSDFELQLIYDPVVDYKNLGAYIAINYQAKIDISVKRNGDFHLIVDHEFKHETLNTLWKDHIAKEKAAQDMSFISKFEHTGNFSNIITDTSMVKDTIHVQYRNKTKKRLESV